MKFAMFMAIKAVLVVLLVSGCQTLAGPTKEERAVNACVHREMKQTTAGGTDQRFIIAQCKRELVKEDK